MIGPETEKVKVHHVKSGALDLTLFTHSFLGLGQDTAQQLSLRLAESRLSKPDVQNEVRLREALTAFLVFLSFN